jgi:CRP-like cAMP-binding protein
MPRSAAPGHAPLNRLLANLPAREFGRLRPHLEAIPLALRTVLHEPGRPIPHVYFPTTCVISLLCPPDGRQEGIEIGVVGREGLVGLGVFLGAEASAARCMVQVPGEALRMRAEDFRRRVGRNSPLHGVLLRYTHDFLTQVTQSVLCNALHPVGKRLARWVLTVHTRAGTNHFPLTHELLAAMLGVRRASVTEAARQLQQAGLIRYGRGEVTVLDRRGLESSSCGCHRAVDAELARLHT